MRLGRLSGPGGECRREPTLARSVRQVDFVICLYTTQHYLFPKRPRQPWRGVPLARTLRPLHTTRPATVPRIDVESLRYFTVISVMNHDLLWLKNADQKIYFIDKTHQRDHNQFFIDRACKSSAYSTPIKNETVKEFIFKIIQIFIDL